MNEDANMTTMTIREFKGEIKSAAVEAAMEVPRTFFKDACNDCFERKSQALGEDLTGKDLTNIKDRDHIKDVFKHSENTLEKSKLIKTTIFVESIKWMGLAFAIFLGLKK